MRTNSFRKVGKALASAALALVVAWACAGGVAWQAARIIHYHVVRFGMEEEAAADTVRLTAESKVVWMVEDELRIDGRMFDVRERTRSGADWILVGHYDSADDEIFALLHALFGLGSQRGEGARRCCIFLPEAALMRVVQHRSPLAFLPRPLYNPLPDDGWVSVTRSVPEDPPEADS